jgi:hypothetical protein
MNRVKVDIDGVIVYDSGVVVPPVHTCPVGQHWDGTACVPDVIVPPGPPPDWDQQALVRPLIHQGQQWGFWGYNRAADGVDFPFQANRTYMFLLDPKKTTKTGKPPLTISNADQGTGALTLEAWTLDANYAKVKPIPFVGPSLSWKGVPWTEGTCILVKVVTSSAFPGLMYW